MKEPKDFEGKNQINQEPFLWVRHRLLQRESILLKEINYIMSKIFPANEHTQFLDDRRLTKQMWYNALYREVPLLDASLLSAFKHIAEIDGKLRFCGTREHDKRSKKKTGKYVNVWKIIASERDFEIKISQDLQGARGRKEKNDEIFETAFALMPDSPALARLKVLRDQIYTGLMSAGHANAGNPEAMNTSPYSIFNLSEEEILKQAKEHLEEDRFKNLAKLFVKELIPDF